MSRALRVPVTEHSYDDESGGAGQAAGAEDLSVDDMIAEIVGIPEGMEGADLIDTTGGRQIPGLGSSSAGRGARAVPEPTAALMFGLGAVLVSYRLRR